VVEGEKEKRRSRRRCEGEFRERREKKRSVGDLIGRECEEVSVVPVRETTWGRTYRE